MPRQKRTDILEVAVHIIIILVGVVILFISRTFQDNSFWQSLLINIGSSLVVVTILFFIFEGFRRRHDDQGNMISDNSQIQSGNYQDARANEVINSLRSKQRFPITTNSSKVNNKQSDNKL